MFFPAALWAAILSYKYLSESEIPEDAKGFSAHHSACKVAIAHIELLIKLARRIIEEGKNDKESAADIARINDMIGLAQEELLRAGIPLLEDDPAEGNRGDSENDDDHDDDTYKNA